MKLLIIIVSSFVLLGFIILAFMLNRPSNSNYIVLSPVRYAQVSVQMYQANYNCYPIGSYVRCVK